MTLSHYCKSMWLSLLLASYNGKVLIESLAHTDSDPDETSSDPDCFTEPEADRRNQYRLLLSRET